MIVKRVVAVAGETGETVETVELRGGRLYVNGQLRASSGAHGAVVAQSPDMRYPLRVTEGYFFAMGDDREASSDSRSFGPQPLQPHHREDDPAVLVARPSRLLRVVVADR